MEKNITKLSDNGFYKEHEDLYNVLSDYINDNFMEAPINGVAPKTCMPVDISDCFLDSEGNLFVPHSYEWHDSYMANNDADVYTPLYMTTPTLDKLAVQNLLAEYQQQDLKNPANNL